MMKEPDKYYNVFGILFIITSMFAFIGSLYSWGDGPIYVQNKSMQLLLPITDLIITFPLALISGLLLLTKRELGQILGLVLTGALLFGSVAVCVSLYLQDLYRIELLIPAVLGLIISISYIIWYRMMM